MRLVPVFRLPWETIQRDVDRILDLGVKLELNHPVDSPPEELLQRWLRRGLRGGRLPEGHAAQYSRASKGKGVSCRAAPARPGRAAASGSTWARRRWSSAAATRRWTPSAPRDRLTGQPDDHRLPPHAARRCRPARRRSKARWKRATSWRSWSRPVRVILDADGKVVALECVRNRLGEPGPDGRRRPLPIPGSEFQIPCDTVIIAVGPEPRLRLPERQRRDAVQRRRHRHRPRDGCSRRAGRLRGRRRGARRAGEHHRGLRRRSPRRREHLPPVRRHVRSAAGARCRCCRSTISSTYKHVRARKERAGQAAMLPDRAARELRPDRADLHAEDQARREGARCVQCTTFCDKCVEVCPNRANMTFLMEAVQLRRCPSLAVQGGELGRRRRLEPFRVDQNRQIVNINDFCNECGDCETFCVHEGRPLCEKPRLFLNEADFLKRTTTRSGSMANIDPAPRERSRVAADATQRRRPSGLRERQRARHVTLASDYTVQAMELKQPSKARCRCARPRRWHVVYKGISETLPHLT